MGRCDRLNAEIEPIHESNLHEICFVEMEGSTIFASKTDRQNILLLVQGTFSSKIANNSIKIFEAMIVRLLKFAIPAVQTIMTWV